MILACTDPSARQPLCPMATLQRPQWVRPWGRYLQWNRLNNLQRWRRLEVIQPQHGWFSPKMDYRRKFRSQTSDNMDRWKAETGRVREKRRVEERRSEKRKSQKKEAQMRQKVGKSRNTVFFPMICGSGGSQSRLAKAAGAEPSGQMRDEKVHVVVARSTFESDKAKNTSRSEHFWKLRCRKSARRCGAKHISKSKCTKHTNQLPFLKDV